jgi:hypothetical protein
MKKRISKLLKRSFVIFLALIAFILFFIPMPALSSDVRFAKDLTIAANEVVNDDVYLADDSPRRGCANESESTVLLMAMRLWLGRKLSSMVSSLAM